MQTCHNQYQIKNKNGSYKLFNFSHPFTNKLKKAHSIKSIISWLSWLVLTTESKTSKWPNKDNALVLVFTVPNLCVITNSHDLLLEIYFLWFLW